MEQHVEAQQSRFERISVLLEALCGYEHDKMSGAGKALLEEAVTEAALGAEDAQLALDNHGAKAV